MEREILASPRAEEKINEIRELYLLQEKVEDDFATGTRFVFEKYNNIANEFIAETNKRLKLQIRLFLLWEMLSSILYFVIL